MPEEDQFLIRNCPRQVYSALYARLLTLDVFSPAADGQLPFIFPDALRSGCAGVVAAQHSSADTLFIFTTVR